MDKENIKREEEIAELREQKGMTFKAIGELYQISPGKASRLYQRMLHRRRIIRLQEQNREENQKLVSFELTLGEAVTLQRILSFYQRQIFRKNSWQLGREDSVFHDPDYITSEDLSRRLFILERENRVMFSKKLDI